MARSFLAALVLVAMATGTAVATVLVADRERADRRQVAGERADGVVANARVATGQALGLLASVRGLYDASESVTAAEFEAFTRPLVRDTRVLDAVWWIPTRARSGLARAATRSGLALGDTAARAARRGTPTASRPAPLRPGGKPVELVSLAVYTSGGVPVRRTNVTGLVVGALDARGLVAKTIAGAPAGTELAIDVGGVRLGGNAAVPTAPVRRTLDVGGREWTLVVGGPTPAGGAAWAVGAGGALLTLLVAALLFLAGRRERYARDLVGKTESRRRALLANLPATSVSLVGSDGRYLAVEGRLLEDFGIKPSEVVGRPVGLYGSAVTPRLRAAVDAALGGEHRQVPHRGQPTDGRFLDYEIAPAEENGKRAALIVARDMTPHHLADLARRDAEVRYRNAFEHAPIGMVTVGVDGGVEQVNEAFGALTGRSPGALAGTALGDLLHPDDGNDGLETLAQLFTGRRDRHDGELRLLHADGHGVCASVHATLIRGADGEPLHILCQIQDITARRRYEARLQYMADHDPLTGLFNRRRMEQELERHLAHAARYEGTGALLVLDLDNFKAVNDTLGHSAGDELIVSIAGLLRDRLRASDQVGRLGGDEFAVLLPQADAADAEVVAGAIVEAVRAHSAVLGGASLRSVTASVGVAVFDAGAERTAEEWLVDADLAMYDAKEAGRDRYARFQASAHADYRSRVRLDWLDRIRRAIAEDGFELHAQPIVCVATGEIERHELLLRMRSEDGNLIPPGSFLYTAERFDVIQDIDRWVVRRAIALLEDEARAGRYPRLEVNLSGKSLGDPELLAVIEDGLAGSGLERGQLTFEITETSAVANIQRAKAFAERVSGLGCPFALDDFGAGFGSFYYLKHLPFDVLKIDGEFISNCVDSPTDKLVIEAVVNIARGMGKHTVAEFVGDDATMELLRRYGVDLAQGYHLGKPRPVAEALAAAVPMAAAGQSEEPASAQIAP